MSGQHSHSRVTILQTLAWGLQAFAYDVFSFFLRLLPIDAASGLGGAVLRLIGPLTGAHAVARRNLLLAFPEMSREARDRLLSAQWENVGRLAAEFPMMERLLTDNRIELIGGERLAEIARAGEPVVFVSGHLSNWEVMPMVIANSGVVCQMTYRAANNPFIDRRIIESRRRYGVNLFAPKGGAGSREIIAAMGQGESVALMNDQKFNQGIEAPFFGHPAHTAPGPTRLALRFGAVLQTMSVQRTRGARFRVVVHEPIRLAQTNDRQADIEAGVAQVNAFMEARIRERPHEWFWVHRRWPKAVYAALAAKGAGPIA